METFARAHAASRLMQCRRVRSNSSAALSRGRPTPEQKRKIIGRLFVDVFTRPNPAKIKNAQAGWRKARSIPDVIESAGGKTRKATNIKSPPQRRRPAGDAAASSCSSRCASCSRTRCASSASPSGCRARWSIRHPFPGPGLGVRILGVLSGKKSTSDLLQRADDDLHPGVAPGTVDLVSDKTWYQLTSQAFAVFLPVQAPWA